MFMLIWFLFLAVIFGIWLYSTVVHHAEIKGKDIYFFVVLLSLVGFAFGLIKFGQKLCKNEELDIIEFLKSTLEVNDSA